MELSHRRQEEKPEAPTTLPTNVKQQRTQ